MSSPDRQPWDSSGVAESIESYWRAEAHEQLHREGLADLVCHCLPAASATILEVGCGPWCSRERLRTVVVRRTGLPCGWFGIASPTGPASRGPVGPHTSVRSLTCCRRGVGTTVW